MTAHRLLNRARMHTATTGTGTMTLGSAVTGCATFAEAGATAAATYTYIIEDGNDFELGRGTYATAGPTLTRDTVLLSKISGVSGTTKLTLSGSAQVAITAAAEDFSERVPLTTRGDLLTRSATANARVAIGTSGYALMSDGTDPAWTGFLQAGTGATTRTWQTKLRERISPLDFGCVGDGATDDTTNFQEALDYAATLATDTLPVVLDLCGKSYAISATLDCDDHAGVTVENGKLVAIGAGWATSNPMIDMHLTGATNRRMMWVNVIVECSQKCSGFYIRNNSQATLRSVAVYHHVDFGIRTDTKATELILDACDVKEWSFGEAGELDPALRVGVGYDINSADFVMSNCIGAYGLIQARFGETTAFFNAQVTGCHFYSGSSGTPTVNHVGVEQNASYVIFTNCYFDNCVVEIRNNFTTLIGCLFVQSAAVSSNTKYIDVITATASDTGHGLLISSNTFVQWANNYISFSTTGAGSWVADASKTCTIYGNTKSTGNLVQMAFGRLAVPDLYMPSGSLLDFDNGNWTATHSSGVLTVGTGDLRITTAGTNGASTVTVGGTQTLTNKTIALGSNTISGTLAEFDAALTDGNFVVEADIGVSVQAYDADLTTWAGITPAAGVGTFLATPSSANLAAAVTDETGSGALVFATSPTLVTPALGTPSSGTLTNCTGLPIAGGGTGAATAQAACANLAAGYMLAQSAVAVSVSATTSEEVLATIAVPANAMGANGVIFVDTSWTVTNSANNKTLRVRFGASGAGTGGTAMRAPVATTIVSHHDYGGWANRNATNSQVALAANGLGNGWGSSSSGLTTAAIDTTAATEIAITGQKANSGETLTLERYTVWLYYKA